MNYQVSYDLESIKTLQKDIKKNGNELLGALDKILKEVNELDNIYDTPSGKLFKEKMVEFINNEKNYIKENYLPFYDIMNVIIKEYGKDYDQTKKMVGGN